jgi:DNA-binding transcriptional regulator/RsmH inhibitor MraZ
MGFSFYFPGASAQIMAEEVIVKIDERGRVTIPQGTRVAIGINGEETWLRIQAEQVDPDDPNKN